MEDILENKLICRICLKVVDQTQQSYGNIEDETGTLRDMMLCCIPEMDIYVSLNPILCFPCIQTLVGLYNFKTKCINTETIIKTYMQRHNISEFGNVNLTCVVRDLIQINNFQRQMQDKKGQEPKKNDVINRTVEPNRTKERADDVSKVASEQPPPIEERVSSTAASSSEETPMENESQQPVKESRETSEVLSSVKESSDCQNSGALKNTEVQNGSGSVGMKEGASVHPKSEKSDKEGTDGEVVTISKDDIYRETDEEDSSMQSSSGPNSSLQDGSLQESSIQTMETDQIVLNHFLHIPKEEKDADAAESIQIYQCLNCQFMTTSTTGIVEHQNVCQVGKISITETQTSSTAAVPRISLALFTNSSVLSTKPVVISTNLASTSATSAPNPTASSTNLAASSTNESANSRLSSRILTPTDCAAMFTISEAGMKEYRCPHCPHITNRAHALSKHINSMHTKAVWFHCDFCQYRSTDRSCLRRHIKNLHAQKGVLNDLTCEQCGYQCTTEHNFRRHLLKHESGMLQCPFCSYSSKDRSNFRKHLFVHNQTEYPCRFCKYTCYSPYQLKLHLKNKHNSAGTDDVDCRSEIPLDMLVDEISKAINQAGQTILGSAME